MHMIRPWLYTGNYADTQDRAYLEENGVEAMVQLFRPAEHDGIPSLYIPTLDGYPILISDLETGLAFIRENFEQNKRILIACGSGVSRSSLFAVAALCVIEDLSMADAFWQVRQANPRAMPDQIQWNSVASYFGEASEFWDIWRDAEL